MSFNELFNELFNSHWFKISYSGIPWWPGILSFHCCGPGSVPGWGIEFLQATWHGKKKKFLLKIILLLYMVMLVVKNLPASAGNMRPGFCLWVGKIPWRRAWQPTPVFLPGESPSTERPGELQSMRVQRVGHN